MSEHTFKREVECEACEGTGLYVGMAERDGAAVVCHRCAGHGSRILTVTYRDFEGRRQRNGVRRVYRTNPGICIGEGNGCQLTDFGGVPYQEWLDSERFPEGTEDRAHTCPAWFYQSADYEKKPDWDECMDSLGGTFSTCPHFETKAKCWERFDAAERELKRILET